jgi:putative methionine-R-sulfoxide reductase with GAF domain
MFFTNIDDIEDVTTRGLLRSSGCQSQVAVPIFDKTSHLIGVLVLDWVFSEIPQEFLNGVEFTSDFRETIDRQANSIMNQIII